MNVNNLLRSMEKYISADIYRNFNLKNKNTIGIDCIAQLFVIPHSVEDIIKLRNIQKDNFFKIFVLGAGSNVLFSNDFLPACVMSTEKLVKSNWSSKNREASIMIEAGYSLRDFVRGMIKNNISGGEFMAGIPGTVGGALAGNAGAQGLGICDIVSWVEVLELSGERILLKKDDINYAYRYSNLSLNNRIILSCSFNLCFLNKTEEVKNKYVYFLKQRNNQPNLLIKSAGCIFKNPPNDSAGRLLDLYKCKGLRFGGAVISDQHANFIINDGNATFSDILSLIEICRKRVFEESGVFLELEVKIIGG